MKRDSILSDLKTQRPYLLQEYGQKGEDGKRTVSCKKIFHIRADYDGYRWWNSIWPCNKELATLQVRREADLVYDRLIADDAFQDLTALREFCRKYPEAAVHGSKDEYNFYFDGELCVYWLRCITRRKDYNLYLYVFAKEDENG